MSEYTDRILSDMQRVYDFFDRNPGESTRMLGQALRVQESTALFWAQKGIKQGYLSRQKGRRALGSGQTYDCYYAIPQKRPVMLPAPKPRPKYKPRAHEISKRVFVKATQRGVKADPYALPREFFGAPGAQGAA